jgi:trehalose 6-phosphate phosphatase
MSAGSPPPPETDWAWFLDVDGTLLELAERPDAVQVEPGLLRALQSLREAARGALALVSGRSVAELDALFAPLRLAAAGQHGVERRDAAGQVHRHAFPAEALRAAAQELAAFARAHAGILLEDKGASLALHFRLAPQQADAARAALERAAARLGAGFLIQPGKMVLELKPAGRDKGVAIEEFLREPPFAGRVPVFVGDDLTDEHGFEAVQRRGGHAVKVGEGPSVARWRLPDAAAVRRWLADAGARSR